MRRLWIGMKYGFQGPHHRVISNYLLKVATLTYRFASLTALSLSSNQLLSTQSPISNSIESLTLEYNNFDSIFSIRHLTILPNLARLSLRGNDISGIRPGSPPDIAEDDAGPSLVFSPTLTAVDISANKINTWSFIDSLPSIFPGLSSLRISDNPLYDQPPAPARITNLPEKPMTVDEAYMF